MLHRRQDTVTALLSAHVSRQLASSDAPPRLSDVPSTSKEVGSHPILCRSAAAGCATITHAMPLDCANSILLYSL